MGTLCDRIINADLMTVHIHARSIFLCVGRIINVIKSNESETARLFSFLIVHQLTTLNLSVTFENTAKFIFRSSAT